MQFFAELREEGYKEVTKDVAEGLINKNISNDQIAEITDLELKEIVELRKSLLS